MRSENNKNKVKQDILEPPVAYDEKLSSYHEARARIFAEQPQHHATIHLNGDQLTQEEDDYDSTEEPAYSGSEDAEDDGQSSDREDEMRMRRRDRRSHRDDEGEENYEGNYGEHYGSEGYGSEDEEYESSELGEESSEPLALSEPGYSTQRSSNVGSGKTRTENTSPFVLDTKYHGQLYDPSSYSRDLATLLSPTTSSTAASSTNSPSISSSTRGPSHNFVSQSSHASLNAPNSPSTISASAQPFVPNKAPLLSSRGQPYPSANGSSTPGGYIPTAEEYATLLQKYHSLSSLHDNCKNVNNLLVTQRDDLRRQLVDTVATLQDKKVLIPEINTRLHSLLQLIHALGLAHPQFQHLLEPIASGVNKLCQLSSPHVPLPAPTKPAKHNKQTDKKKAQEPAKEPSVQPQVHSPQIPAHSQTQSHTHAHLQVPQSPPQEQSTSSAPQSTHKHRHNPKSNPNRKNSSSAHQARLQAQNQALLQSQYQSQIQAQIQAQIFQAQLIQAAQMQAHNYSTHLPLQPPSSRGNKSNKNGGKRTNPNRQPKSAQPQPQMMQAQQPMLHHVPTQFYQPAGSMVPLPLPLPTPHPSQLASAQLQSQKRPPQKSKKLYDPNTQTSSQPQPPIGSPLSPQQTHYHAQSKVQSPQSPPPQLQSHAQPTSRIPRSYQQQHLQQQQLIQQQLQQQQLNYQI